MNIKDTIKGMLNIPTKAEEKEALDLKAVQEWTFHASSYVWYDPYVHYSHSGLLFPFLGAHLPQVGEHVGITASWLTRERGYYGAALFGPKVFRIDTIVRGIHHNMWGGGTIDLDMEGLWERGENHEFQHIILPSDEQVKAWEAAKNRKY